MSSKCLWHACRALSAGLLLMLLGAAMAVIGYYAETLSVDQEVRGNATVSVKDEARGFHLNNLSYAGPIVMGFGGFIVVAACVMTFEARDSAAKVTPARPQALPRPLPRRAGACAAPARLDQLGVYRLPHVLPLPHSLPLVPLHTHRHRPTQLKIGVERVKGKARFGSAPDLRCSGARAALPAAALRRPLRRYALSVDEPRHSAVSASAAESECGSQSSLAMDLHASGACAGVTLRVRDNTRRRPLARQQRLRDDTVHPTPVGSTNNVNNAESEISKAHDEELNKNIMEMPQLSLESEVRAHSAPPPAFLASPLSPTQPPVSLASQPPVSLASQPPVSLASQPPVSLASKPPVSLASLPPVSLTSPSSLVSQPSMSSASPPLHASPPPSPRLDVTRCATPSNKLPETCITIEHLQQDTPTEEEIPVDSESAPPLDIRELLAQAPRDGAGAGSADATQHDADDGTRDDADDAMRDDAPRPSTPQQLCIDPC